MKNYLPIFLVCLSALLLPELIAQENRSFDGSGNNLTYQDYGAANSLLPDFGTVGFADGIAAPAGPNRPNPRVISNTIFMQNSLADDVRGLSAYAWAWGQFIDHDVTLSRDHPTETLDISVPPFDLFFDPSGSGTVTIPMHRSAYDPSTGTSTDNPRRYLNSVTAFVDGSAVYGSSQERADWLRTFTDGKLKTSQGNLLPYNTLTGEAQGAIDPQAPEMDMPLPFVTKWFVAGDIRANENPVLTALHTIFVREHNRLCDELKNEYPNWDDELLFQRARKLVGAYQQAIVFHEWLPALGIHLPDYEGFDDQLNPGIMNAFNTAAYRYGHTTINNVLVRRDLDGQELPQGDILLRDAFFNPAAIKDVNGIEPYLIGMATMVEQDFDCKVIDDLRNFLFGPPGSGGLDLVALNINRGRDRGLPDYNTVRTDFGLPAISGFSQMTSDGLMNQALELVYQGDIDKLDPWVGMLSEDHMPDALFGQTAMTIIEQQFLALRDGDRFYYANDPDFSEDEKTQIKQTTLSKLIQRNTPITIIQPNVFMAQPLLTTNTSEAGLEPLAVQVFPNPTYQSFTLEFSAAQQGDADIQVSDLNGKRVLQYATATVRGDNVIQLSFPKELTAGIYWVQIQCGDWIGHRKIIKL